MAGGKAGGVKVAKSAEEAEARANDILGMDIKGHTVRTVMIAEGADIAEEYYFSLLLDRANRSYLAMCSKEGGVEIETLAEERPEALARVEVDPLVGIDQAKADEIVAAAGFDAEDQPKIAAVLIKLWDVYAGEDATLVEVNPLIKTGAGDIVALDGKVTLDDNAEFRHPPDHVALHDDQSTDRWRSRPSRWVCSTSSWTATSASSVTAPAWSCPPSTSSRTPARSSRARRSRPTSSTSVAAPRPR